MQWSLGTRLGWLGRLNWEAHLWEWSQEVGGGEEQAVLSCAWGVGGGR